MQAEHAFILAISAIQFLEDEMELAPPRGTNLDLIQPTFIVVPLSIAAAAAVVAAILSLSSCCFMSGWPWVLLMRGSLSTLFVSLGTIFDSAHFCFFVFPALHL